MSTINNVFTKKLQRLMKHAANLEGGSNNGTPSGTSGNDYPEWFEFGEGPVGPSRFQPTAIHGEFTRDGLSSDFTQLLAKGDDKKSHEVNPIKQQHEWLASLERDYHHRRRTRIRLLAHGASRLHGLAHEKGPIKNGIHRWVEYLLKLKAQ